MFSSALSDAQLGSIFGAMVGLPTLVRFAGVGRGGGGVDVAEGLMGSPWFTLTSVDRHGGTRGHRNRGCAPWYERLCIAPLPHKAHACTCCAGAAERRRGVRGVARRVPGTGSAHCAGALAGCSAAWRGKCDRPAGAEMAKRAHAQVGPATVSPGSCACSGLNENMHFLSSSRHHRQSVLALGCEL